MEILPSPGQDGVPQRQNNQKGEGGGVPLVFTLEEFLVCLSSHFNVLINITIAVPPKLVKV